MIRHHLCLVWWILLNQKFFKFLLHIWDLLFQGLILLLKLPLCILDIPLAICWAYELHESHLAITISNSVDGRTGIFDPCLQVMQLMLTTLVELCDQFGDLIFETVILNFQLLDLLFSLIVIQVFEDLFDFDGGEIFFF